MSNYSSTWLGWEEGQANSSNGSNFTGASESTSRSPFPRFLSLLLGYYGIVVLVLSLAGNLLALAACSKTYHRHPSVLLGYLASLTVADLLFVLLAAFDAGIHLSVRGDWPCKIEGVLTETCYTALVLILVLISYERMKVVSSPILARMRRFRFRKWLPIMVWLAAFALSSPLVFFFKTSDRGVCENLGLGDAARQIYYGMQTVLLYVCSLIFMVWAHAMIFKALGDHATFRNGHATSSVLHSEQKLTRMLVVVIVTFCLCYTPFITVRTIRYFGITGTTVLWKTLWRICELFVFTQAAINPFIFCFFSRQFRKACKEILRCQCQVKHSGSIRKIRGISGTSLELQVIDNDVRLEPAVIERRHVTRDSTC